MFDPLQRPDPAEICRKEDDARVVRMRRDQGLVPQRLTWLL